ncbi:MAG: hypothetical protein O8C63_03940 [Candidatus Methanoperedens sp.]|nr:hypothetical protein [Candidatus Methanoperedens sp.]
MAETAENLAAKHTRREIEEMAEKLGIRTVGVSKLKIAESVVESRKKHVAKETRKVKQEKEVKAFKPMQTIGKRGVFAKQADMEKKAGEIESFVAGLHRSAVEMQQKGIMEMKKGINAQVRENEKAAVKMDSGVKDIQAGIEEMQADIDKKRMEMQRGVREMHRGVAEVRKGIREMENSFMEFRNDTMNYIKDFYYG